MRYRFLVSLLLIGLLSLTACNLVRAPAGTIGTTGDPVADQETLVALAVQQTASASGGGELPPAATFTPTLSPTPSVPLVTVSVATNCRTGPGEPYEIVGILPVGVPAEVVGRNASGDTWIIKLPSNPAITCWLWGFHATTVGSTAGLPVFTPPPTPTPVSGYTLSYMDLLSCGGRYAFQIRINPTGTLTWQSYHIKTYDATTSTTSDYYSKVFAEFSGCLPTILLEDLEPGEVGFAANIGTGALHYDPTGHSITITFNLCTEDNWTGICMEKSLSFVP